VYNHNTIFFVRLLIFGQGIVYERTIFIGFPVISPFDPYYICDEMLVCCFKSYVLQGYSSVTQVMAKWPVLYFEQGRKTYSG